MGWEETCAVTERMKFVLEVQRGERTVAECCRLAGVSRKTGYKWLARYEEGGGPQALQDRSRAAHTHPNAVGLEIKAMLLEARRQHPTWGAVTLLQWLSRRRPKLEFPAPSTVAELLRREGLVKPRVRTRRTPPYTQPFAHAGTPNALWSADFKDDFFNNQVRPLAVLRRSRRLLALSWGSGLLGRGSGLQALDALVVRGGLFILRGILPGKR